MDQKPPPKPLPTTYDKSHYRGASFDPNALGVPQRGPGVPLVPLKVSKKYVRPAPSADEVLSEMAGVPTDKQLAKQDLEDSTLWFRHCTRQQLESAADEWLRATGSKLRRQRGGSQLESPSQPEGPNILSR